MRGLRLWRTIRAFGRALSTALATLLESAAATEAHAVAVTGRTERLTAAAAHLHESLDRLRVLTDAANEARRSLLGVRGLVPKK